MKTILSNLRESVDQLKLLPQYGQLLAAEVHGTGNQWYRQKMKMLRRARGNKCARCGKTGGENGNVLEFAHVRNTPVQGWGRGRNVRVLDILRHPEAYALLCDSCHKALEREQREKAIDINPPEPEGEPEWYDR